MFKKTTSSLDTIGLENKIGPKMEMGPPVFKIPKNLFLFTVVYHSEEHNMTPAMDGEESLQEEEVISSRTGSVPSMEDATYNLANLFVSH